MSIPIFEGVLAENLRKKENSMEGKKVSEMAEQIIELCREKQFTFAEMELLKSALMAKVYEIKYPKRHDDLI